jgi:SAM-dependent methyltransferase
MLKEEAIMIRNTLVFLRGKSVLNVCSSEELFWKEQQPYIWEYVMTPLIARGCALHNLDMKKSKGVDIVADCTDMKCVEDGSYDVVLFTSGVEHIVEVTKALQEIRRVLKCDGFMVCSAPGVYPTHNDPIDTMLRLPTKESWNSLLGNAWEIQGFWTTTPMRADPRYNFNELVFATIVKARAIG